MKNISEKYNDPGIIDEVYNEDLSDLETHVLANKIERKSSYNSELINNLKALSQYLIDGNVKWYKKSLVVVTLAYFLKPKKSLPNWNEFFDFLEDVGAIEWSVRFLGEELKNYY